MANEHVLRVTAGSDPGPRSGVWRIFTYRDDIYVQPRYAGGALKTSFHASGLNRHAFTESVAPRWINDGDRAFVKWEGSPDFMDGAKLLLDIVIPTDELTEPTVEPSLEEKAKITLLDPACAGSATVLSLILMASDREVDVNPRPEKCPSVQLARWALPSRGTLWIVGSHQALDDAFWSGVGAARREIAQQVGDLPAQSEHTRLVMWAYSDTEVARYYDLAADLAR